MINYEEELKAAYEVWNQFNFEDELDVYEDLDQMMSYLSEKYYYDSRLPKEWDGEIFNWCTIEEFADYLRQRYTNFHIDEVTTYRIWR